MSFLDRDLVNYPQRSKFDLVGIDNRRAAPGDSALARFGMPDGPFYCDDSDLRRLSRPGFWVGAMPCWVPAFRSILPGSVAAIRLIPTSSSAWSNRVRRLSFVPTT